MAGNLNKVFLMGNLTRDVELKKTPNNIRVIARMPGRAVKVNTELGSIANTVRKTFKK